MKILSTKSSRFRRSNMLAVLGIGALLGGSAAIGLTMVFRTPHQSTRPISNQQSTSTTISASGGVSDGGITNDIVNDNTPPAGETMFTFSGTGLRQSKVVNLNYSWTAIWSADCSDENVSNSLTIDLVSGLSGAGLKSTNVSLTTPLVGEKKVSILNTTIGPATYESGIAKGVAATGVQLQVYSGCDWNVSIIKTS